MPRLCNGPVGKKEGSKLKARPVRKRCILLESCIWSRSTVIQPSELTFASPRDVVQKRGEDLGGSGHGWFAGRINMRCFLLWYFVIVSST